MAIIEERQDVIVLGAGISGMCAAMRAAEAGARVTILEKAPDAMHSNTAYTGGGWAVFVEPYGPYTLEEIVAGFERTSHGSCNTDLVRAVNERIGQEFTWLRDEICLPMRRQNNRVTPDGRRWGSFMTEGRGAAIPPRLLSEVERRGVKIRFHTPATRLIADASGRVCGVGATAPGGARDYEAGAVIIATGSFEADANLVLQHCGQEVFDTAFTRRVGPPTRTGDGHRMAIAVNASYMRYPCAVTCSAEYQREKSEGRTVRANPLRILDQAHLWGLWINRDGRRFVDETAEVDTISTALMRQPGGSASLIFDAALKTEFEEEFAAYEKIAPGEMLEAESVPELARGIGVTPEELERTLDEYNRAVAPDGRALGSVVPKGRDKPCAVRLERSPFYAIFPVYACLNTIWGGLEVSTRMEVIGRDGKPIRGLYTAGSTFGGIFYGEWVRHANGSWGYTGNHDYYGSSLPTCLATGRIAGESAAEDSA
jgi:succinate dehydrogenase/fumarate reductase flavoprotein subunit